MRFNEGVTIVMTVLTVSAAAPAQEYTYYSIHDFPIQDIDIRDGWFWLAAGRRGAVHFNADTGEYKVMTAEDGLYTDDVLRTVKVDSRGTVWFGMGQGLIEYDGETMTKYDYDTGMALSDFYDIYEAADGTMWFANVHGVFSYDGETWTRYDTRDGLGEPIYRNILPAPDGSLWVSCGREISNFNHGEWTTYKPSVPQTDYRNLWISTMLVDFDGNVWIGTEQGIVKFDGAEWTMYTTEDGLTGNTCKALAQDVNGVIWAATGPDPWSRNSFSVFDGESWSAYPDTDKIVSARIISVHTDDEGTPWFGTDKNEMYCVRDGTLEVVRVETGANSAWMYAITVDNDNAVWIGSDKGVQRLKEGRWRSYYQRDGLPAGCVRDLAVTESGTVWAAADSGVAYFDGDKWHAFTAGCGLCGVSAGSVSSAGDVVWFGTESGLSRYGDGVWTSYTALDGLPDDKVTAVYADSEGGIWAGTESGLAVFDGAAWTTFTTADGLPDNIITAVMRDPRGVVWAGTPAGLAAYDGGVWTSYHTGDGESLLPDDEIKAMAVDRTGRVWFGTNKGSAWFDGTEWGADYKFNSIFDLAVDKDNVLWGTRFSWEGPVVSHSLEDTGPGEKLLPGRLEMRSPEFFYVRDMAVTENSVWIVSNQKSLRFDKASGSLAESPVLTDASPKEVAALSEEKVFLVSDSGVSWQAVVFHMFDGTAWSEAGQISFAKSWTDKVRALSLDPAGNLWYWYGCWSMGKVRTGLGWGTPELSAHCILFASDDTVWIGGNRLVQSRIPYYEQFKSSWDDWRNIELPEEIQHVSAIAEDVNGDILVGTDRVSLAYGMARYDGENWTFYTKESGLLGNRVFDIEVDKRGAIWVSTGGGISYFDGEDWTDITQANSILSKNDGNLIEVDDDGVVWIGSRAQGLFSFTYDADVPVEGKDSGLEPFALIDIHPNPFNPQTAISYTLEAPGSVNLSVYDVLGRKIRELVCGNVCAGRHTVLWNGLDERGEPVSSGVYFAILSNGNRRTAKRMLLLK